MLVVGWLVVFWGGWWFRRRRTYVDLDGIRVREAHMSFGEKSVREQRQKDKLGQSQQLIAGQLKLGAPSKTSAPI